MKTYSKKDLTIEDYIWFKGDCLKLLKAIPDNSVQLIVTSPPYNIQKDYEKGSDLSDYLIFQEQVIEECYRVLKKSGSICWQVGNYVEKGEIVPLDILFYRIFQQHEMKLRNRIIWHFEHGFHAKHKFSGRYETVNWYTKSDDYLFNVDPIRVPQKQPTKRHYKGPKKGELSCNPLGKNPGDVWKFTNIKNGHPEKIEGGHPCQYPIELVEQFILSMTKKNDIVLDPFGGVATTIVASLKHGRVGVSSEKDIDYFKTGKKRIKLFYQDKLPYKGRFEPTVVNH
jgi:adenine-specific DNA-methyltransferase